MFKVKQKNTMFYINFLKNFVKKEVTLNQEIENLKKENDVYKLLNLLQLTIEYAFQEFISNGIERSKMTSMIYGVSMSKLKSIWYIEDEQKPKVHTLDKTKMQFTLIA